MRARAAGEEQGELSARYLSMPLPLGGGAFGRRRALSADMATARAAAAQRGAWHAPPGLPPGVRLPLGAYFRCHPPAALLLGKPFTGLAVFLSPSCNPVMKFETHPMSDRPAAVGSACEGLGQHTAWPSQ